MEEWKPIEGYEGYYEISSYGRVKSFHPRNLPAGKLRHLHWNKRRDYYYVECQIRRSNRKNFRVNRLVAKAFVPGYRPGLDVNHKDGNKRNNHAENLEWLTRSENQKHAFAHGLNTPRRGELCGNSKINSETVMKIRALKRDQPKLRNADIAKMYGLGMSTITHIILGTRWAHLPVYYQGRPRKRRRLNDFIVRTGQLPPEGQNLGSK